jgi:hypothetical protein
MRIEISMRKIILINILSMTFLSETAYAMDAIVFKQWAPPSIVSVKPDGTDLKVIHEEVSAFTVSPNKTTMIVFNDDCVKQDTCTLTVYNFNISTKLTISKPHAEWNMGKWISNDEYYVYREVRQDNGGRACGTDSPERGCAARAIIQTAKFNVNSLSFTIDKDYGVGNFTALEEDFPSTPQESTRAISPDGKYILQWNGAEYWKKSLVLNELGTQKIIQIFKRKPADYSEAYEFTTSPWSPDTKSIVLEYYPGGLFYTIVSGKHKIVVLDRGTLQKRILGIGMQPYWIHNIPSSFSGASRK